MQSTETVALRKANGKSARALRACAPAISAPSQASVETRRKAALLTWSSLCDELERFRDSIEEACQAGHLDDVTAHNVIDALDGAALDLEHGRPRRRDFR